MTVPHKLAFNYLNNNIRLEYISTSSGTFIIRIWYNIYAIEKGLWDECKAKRRRKKIMPYFSDLCCAK